MQDNGLLISKNHLPNVMDVRSGGDLSSLCEQDVIQADHIYGCS
jgi:hypothetical protein